MSQPSQQATLREWILEPQEHYAKGTDRLKSAKVLSRGRIEGLKKALEIFKAYQLGRNSSFQEDQLYLGIELAANDLAEKIEAAAEQP